MLASGPIGELLTRLDLPMAGAEEGGALIDGVVSGYDPAYQLLRVQFPHSALSVQVAHGPLALGQPIGCKVQARDVSLALQPPLPSSILNVLPAAVIVMCTASQSAQSTTPWTSSASS